MINTDDIIWDSLKQMIGEIVYGGRVTDEADRTTLNVILKQFINLDTMSVGELFDRESVMLKI